MRRTGILMMVVVLAATACGSSGPKRAKPKASTSTTAKPSHDLTIIEAGLIRISDLPGYSHKPPSADSSADIEQIAKGLPECAHFVAIRKGGASKRKSPRFQLGNAHVDNGVDVYASTDIVAQQLDLYRDPATVVCLRAVFEKTLVQRIGTNGTIDKTDISPIAVNEAGDGQFAYRLTVGHTANGQSTTLLFDLIGVSVGRYTMSFNSRGTIAEMAELETTLLPKLVDRMHQAGA